MPSPPVLAIVGPTASGKTPLSLFLAEQLGGEIISADSRQLYRQLDIGTAKPSPAELQRVNHHFIDMLDPAEEYNAGLFGTQARAVIRDILERKKTPILVGGSGLYVKAVIDGLFEGPGKDPELRSQLEEKLAREGGEVLLEDLRRIDPDSASKMNPTKPRRIVRALEVYYTTGVPLSKFHAEQVHDSPYQFKQIALDWERAELYRHINSRVESMIERGLLNEVKALQNKGFSRWLNALNTVGYKELFDHLEDKTSFDRAVELIQQNTRRFAKRQLTWFRADKRIVWMKADGTTDLRRLAERIVSTAA